MKKKILVFLSLCLCLGSVTPVDITAKKKETKTADITISAVGDCALGGETKYPTGFHDKYNKNGASYFLKNVKPVFEKDDVTIVNLECVLTSETKRADKKYCYKGPQKYAEILKKGSVEICNFANNHNADYGEKSFKDTKAALKKQKIAYSVGNAIAYAKKNGVIVAFVGFYSSTGISTDYVKKIIAKAKKKSDVLVVTYHWGQMYQYYPNDRQKMLGKLAIDNGADLVLGHHAHIIQGIEKYKGKYIVYGLGDFCYGGGNPDDKDTMIFQQTFHVRSGKLQSELDAKIVPCSISGSKSNNDYQPRILKGDEKKNLIAKVNKISKGMNITVGEDGKIK